ncbi:Hsp20/alpha crystallin family protein [Spirosoma fluminis]
MATLVRYNNAPSFFNPFFGSHAYGRPVVTRFQNTNLNVPAVNVKETETAFQLELAAPGLKKEDVKVNVEHNKLTIAYKHEEKADETTEKYTRHEFSYNAFERSFRLPKNVNADQITAAYVDGILTVELPKIEVKEEKLVKEITVA